MLKKLKLLGFCLPIEPILPLNFQVETNFQDHIENIMF